MKDIKNFIKEASQDDLEDMTQDLSYWWDENVKSDFYDSHSEFIKDMKAMTKKQNDKLVQDAFDYLTDECEWDKKVVAQFKNNIINVLVQWANDTLEEMN